MPQPANIAAYHFLSELLLYPEERDARKLASSAEEAVLASPELRGTIAALMANPELEDSDTYLGTFEISPKCPLHLGHYLFEEPTSCSGAAISGRNEYMIQLKNLYRHFGFELQGRELPDFLPLLLDFLALTASHPDRERRVWTINRYLLPALPGLAKALAAANNLYTPVGAILDRLLREEAGGAAAEPAPTPVAAKLCNAT